MERDASRSVVVRMKLPRQIGLVDFAVVTVLLVMVVLPPREMFAAAAAKGTNEAQQFSLALAEARTISDPTDGQKVSDLTRRLGDLNYKDWAVDAAVAGTKRAAGSPTEWKTLLAASIAYVDKVDVKPALDYVTRALAACRALGVEPTAATQNSTLELRLPGGCPAWEEARMSLYQQHLDAGVKSGIDPRKDPKGFRRAGETAIRSIRLNTPSN
jgi:hypothetical protein